MSDKQSALYLKAGLHASTTDFSTVPSLVDLLPEKFDGFGSPDTVKLARNPAHPQNKRFPALRGPIDLNEAIPLEFIVRGLNGNNGGAITSSTTNDLVGAGILTAIFGAAPTDPAGVSTTATGGTGASSTLTVTEQARFPVGTVIMFATTTPTATYVRQVVSRAGGSGSGDLTLDRTYSGTVTNGQTVVRFSRYVWDPSIHEHKHLCLRAEWENFMRTYVGCMSLATFDFSVGQFAKLMTSWRFTDVSDAAENNPTFSEQTTGGAIVNVANNFYIGNSTFYVPSGLKLELGGTLGQRKANAGPNGIEGFGVFKGGGTPKAKITARFYRGVNSGEIADSTGTPSVNTLQGYGSDTNAVALGAALTGLDVAFQVGTAAGSCLYVRAPNASVVKTKDVVEDGFQCIDVEFECDTPNSSSFYPVEFNLG